MAHLMPTLKQQFFNSNGVALSGGKVYSYQAGTSTPLATYVDQTEATPNANPTILNANGEADIWLGSSAYKLIIKDSSDVTIRTVDNVSHINIGGVTNAKLADMAQATIKGRNSGVGTGAPSDLTATQATAILDPFTGDSGSGGVKGLVPAPAAGDAKTNFVNDKYLSPGGTWKAPTKIELVLKKSLDAMIRCAAQYPWSSPTLVSNPATLPAGDGIGVEFSPTKNILAVAHNTTPFLTIYEKIRDTFIALTNISGIPAGSGTGCAWSQNEKYLAVSHFTTPYLSIYLRREWMTFTKMADPATLPTGNANSIAWSLSGGFLAVAHTTTPYITIYQVDDPGTTFVFGKLADPATLPTGNAVAVAWSPNGEFLAVGHNTTPFITIYQKTGRITFTKLADPATLPPAVANGLSFSPNGEFLAVAHDTTPFITIYQISGTTFTKLANPATLPAGTGRGVAWSPNGEFLAVGHNTTPFITIYQRAGTTFTKLADPAGLPPSSAVGVSWSCDNKYLAVGHFTTPFITIYKTASAMPTDAVLFVKEVPDV